MTRERIEEIKYAVSRENRVHISASRNVREVIRRFAKMHRIRMIEALWRLVFMGLKYDIQGPDPRRKELARLSATLRENFMRRHGKTSGEGIDGEP